jgi:hypothetical protein
VRKPWTKAVETKWIRNCPKCSNVLYYSSRNNLNKAAKKGSVCMNCKNEFTDEYRQKISDSLKGRSTGNRQYRKRSEIINRPFKRNCPSCNKEIGYTRRDRWLRANRGNTVCNSCSSKIYKKSWTYVIKEEHTQKMAATKAGFDTFDEYMANLAAKKVYYRAVRKISKAQDISRLENFDKLRGLCGIEGAYQLDHVISVDEGFHKNISPGIIGDLSNLRIVPWRDNLLKSNKEHG